MISMHSISPTSVPSTTRPFDAAAAVTEPWSFIWGNGSVSAPAGSTGINPRNLGTVKTSSSPVEQTITQVDADAHSAKIGLMLI